METTQKSPNSELRHKLNAQIDSFRRDLEEMVDGSGANESEIFKVRMDLAESICDLNQCDLASISETALTLEDHGFSHGIDNLEDYSDYHKLAETFTVGKLVRITEFNGRHNGTEFMYDETTGQIARLPVVYLWPEKSNDKGKAEIHFRVYMAVEVTNGSGSSEPLSIPLSGKRRVSDTRIEVLK